MGFYTKTAQIREERHAAATRRNEPWKKLTPAQQLAELDVRFGKGLGATKQRAKLAKRIALPAVRGDADHVAARPEVKAERHAKQSRKEAHDQEVGNHAYPGNEA